ncbi:MAG: hypothetical protein PF442_02480 [Desulfobulbaceae bacterium]|jgi:hypothetical protein|nr:hypothetical protein [Desulfobulbaceae bacterium]
MIENRLILLRKTIREKNTVVTKNILNNHTISICVVCGTDKDLTKEHVIPKWAFGNDQKKFFTTNINNISQSYSQAVLPTCGNCNSYILGAFEHYLESLFAKTDLNSDFFSTKEKEKIILWLESIDYKFQALNLRRKFKKMRDGKYIPYLSDIPIGVMQNESPSKVFSNFRNALKKLGIKSKAESLNSLVIFKTTNESFHFFHKTNEFIFIELPKQKIALFYFITLKFDDEKIASETAMRKIKEAY